jgi:hypothetical protein
VSPGAAIRGSIVALVAVSACTVFARDPDELDRLHGVSTPSTRACVPTRPPGPPPPQSAGGAERTFFTVFTSLELLPPSDPRGFDLDDHCTCPEPPSCRGDPSASSCDGPGGIDNTLGGIVAKDPTASLLINPQQLHEHFARGESNIIIYVTAYNGLDDDDSVDVHFLRSTGTIKSGQTPTVPKFDGADSFDCVSEDVALCQPTGILPSGAVQHGYVRGRTLIVPDARFVLSVLADSPIHGRGVLTATLEPFAPGASGEPRWALHHGVVAGALPINDVMTALAAIETAPGVTLCGQENVIPYIKAQLCNGRDMAFAGGASCDAVSAVFAFDAVPFSPHDKATLPSTTPCAAAEATCE